LEKLIPAVNPIWAFDMDKLKKYAKQQKQKFYMYFSHKK